MKSWFDSKTIRGLIVSFVSFAMAYAVQSGILPENMPQTYQEWLTIILNLTGFSGIAAGVHGRIMSNGEKLTWGKTEEKP